MLDMTVKNVNPSIKESQFNPYINIKDNKLEGKSKVIV